MKAIEYLEQIEKLDTLIENKLFEKERWKCIALGTSANSGGERVQSSGSSAKMEDAVHRYIEIEEEIDRIIGKYVDKKQEITDKIEQLPLEEYNLLHKRYVQFISLKECADIMGKSYSWVTHNHRKALKDLQNILDGGGKSGL